ncbi:MAG: hypothetical protein LBS96_01940, partial [Oscillospiraceae bacterium]|nr:hypothetical protein [Oscillospiraceae bacterium]
MKKTTNAIQATGRVARRSLGFLLALLMLISVLMVPGLAGSKAETEVKAGSGSEAQFYAPETVYLKAREATSQYFVDAQAANGGALNRLRDKNSGGSIYFDAPGANVKTLSYALAETSPGSTSIGIASLKVTGYMGTTINANAHTGNTGTIHTNPAISSNINAVLKEVNLTAPLADHEWVTIQWKVTYTLDVPKAGGGTETTNNVAYAYTVIYAPFTGETGVFGRYKRTDAVTTYPDINMSYAFIAGIHGTAGGDYSRIPSYVGFDGSADSIIPAIEGYYGAANGGYMRGATWGIWDNNGGAKTKYFPTTPGGGIYQWDHESSGDHFYGSTPTAYGTITVDTSRYKNLSEVPNLSVGDTVFFIYDANKENRINSINIISGVGSEHTIKGQTISSAPNNVDAGVWTNGLYPLTTPASWQIVSGSLIIETFYYQQYTDSWKTYTKHQSVKQRTRLEVNAVDKTSLRQAVRSAIAAPLNTGNATLAATLPALQTALEYASRVLGYPEADQSTINGAVDALKAAVAATRDTMAVEALMVRSVGSVDAPEAVYLKPGYTTPYFLLTKDNLKVKIPDAGNMNDTGLFFTLPSDVGSVQRQISYYTIDASGNESTNILNSLSINGTALAPKTLTNFAEASGKGFAAFSFDAKAATTEGAIVWVFSYLYLGNTYETYAVTWIHPTPTVQAGVAVEDYFYDKSSWADVNPFDGRSTFFAFLVGIHSASGGNATAQFNAVSGAKANPLIMAPNISGNYGRGYDSYDDLKVQGTATQGTWGGYTSATYNRIPVGVAVLENTDDYFKNVAGGVWNTGYIAARKDIDHGRKTSGVTLVDRDQGPRQTNLFKYQTDNGGIPHAQLTVDVSRVDSYKQVPFLSVGVEMYYWENDDDHIYIGKIDNFREVTTTSYSAFGTLPVWGAAGGDTLAFNVLSTALSVMRASSSGKYEYRTGSAGLLGAAQGTISSALGFTAKATVSHLLGIDWQQRWEGDNTLNNGANAGDSFSYLWLDTAAVDKGTLRTRYQDAIKVFRAKDYYNEDDYNAYKQDVIHAGMELGRVMKPTTLTVAQWQAEFATLAARLEYKTEAHDASYVNIDGS